MKTTALLLGVLLAVSACRTSPATPDDAAEKTAEQQPSSRPGPFEVAEAWIDGGDHSGAGVADLLQSFSQPVVERMHRSEDGKFVALIADASSAGSGEAFRLVLSDQQSGWQVESSEIVPADYLWPTQ